MKTSHQNRTYVARWHRKHGNPKGTPFIIRNLITGETYPGITVSPLKKRLWQAIAAANQGRTDPLSSDIRAHGKENFVIEKYLPTEDQEPEHTPEPLEPAL